MKNHLKANGVKNQQPKTYRPFPDLLSRFYYVDNSKCEVGLRDIENYEDLKDVSDLNFELTFRFTDEKMENAEPCNIQIAD